MAERHQVFVAECHDYDVARIREIVKRGMTELGYLPRGKVFAKPNAVFAFQPERFGCPSFTDPGLVEAALGVLAHSPGVTRVDLGEKSGMGIPTRLSYQHAGYFDAVDRVRASVRASGRFGGRGRAGGRSDGGAPVRVRAVCMDEEPRTQVFVGGAVHDRIRLNRQMAEADTLVYLPKLKCHCVSKMTGAVKLNIGILCDDERAIRHDFLLDEKIADLLGPGNPDLVIMDAITVGMGNEVVPTPRHLGLLIMARSAIAADVVAARLLGLAPAEVPYLATLFRRGLGPSSPSAIDLVGDITSWDALERAAKRLLPKDEEYYRWQDVNTELRRLESPLRLVEGPYAAHTQERCKTGCVMGLKMFLGVLELIAGAEAFAAARPQTFVVGRAPEPIDGRGDIVWLVGSCARADITNASEVVRIDRCFTTATDLFLTTRSRMGIDNPFYSAMFLRDFLPALLRATATKVKTRRYAQDLGHFVSQHLLRRV